MRVAISPDLRWSPVAAPDEPASAMLDPAGARVILGDQISADGLPDPVAPRPHTMFGPRGVAMVEGGPLFVCDTGHHRLMIWDELPTRDNAPADHVVGQPDAYHEGRNGHGAVGPATLNMPTGISTDGTILAVADAWNHRILIWTSLPTRSNQPADLVLGQTDFGGGMANRGGREARSDTLNWCYGVTIADGRLFVADTGNRRVLVWNSIPNLNGQPADLVLGQPGMTSRDDNIAGTDSRAGMRWPHTVAVDDGRILVADAGNNRIMAWTAMPNADGAPCSFVLGQAGFDGVDHNRAGYRPGSTALNMPYGLLIYDARLLCADTANSRLVGYPLDGLEMDAAANRLAGQRGFANKGDNRWRMAARDSMCWPFGLAACGNTLAIADTGNNRVLLWDTVA